MANSQNETMDRIVCMCEFLRKNKYNKDTIKNNLKTHGIRLSDWEKEAEDRSNWKSLVHRYETTMKLTGFSFQS